MEENEEFDEEAFNRDFPEDFERILKLCESDPDAGLQFIQNTVKEHPILKSYAPLKIWKARAYQIKGSRPLLSRPWVQVGAATAKELRLYVNDENLNDLELALSEIKQIEDIEPEAVEIFRDNIEPISCILERCRPGRVQQILGKTKLQYFGIDRLSTVPHITSADVVPPQQLKPFFQIPFSYKSIVKSALVFQLGKDTKGRNFLNIWLFSKDFDDFRPEETYGEAKVGELYLFDDGTFSTSFEQEKDIKKESISSYPWLFKGAYAVYQGRNKISIGDLEFFARDEVEDIDFANNKFKSKNYGYGILHVWKLSKKMGEKTVSSWINIGDRPRPSEDAILEDEYEGSIDLGSLGVRHCFIQQFSIGRKPEDKTYLVIYDKKLNWPLKYIYISRKLKEQPAILENALIDLKNELSNSFNIVMGGSYKLFEPSNKSTLVLKERTIILDLMETNIPGLMNKKNF